MPYSGEVPPAPFEANIGTIGHVDQGKTTLTQRFTKPRFPRVSSGDDALILAHAKELGATLLTADKRLSTIHQDVRAHVL